MPMLKGTFHHEEADDNREAEVPQRVNPSDGAIKRIAEAVSPYTDVILNRLKNLADKHLPPTVSRLSLNGDVLAASILINYSQHLHSLANLPNRAEIALKRTMVDFTLGYLYHSPLINIYVGLSEYGASYLVGSQYMRELREQVSRLANARDAGTIQHRNDREELLEELQSVAQVGAIFQSLRRWCYHLVGAWQNAGDYGRVSVLALK